MLKQLKPSYRIVKEIGKGGFAQTFIAVDESQSPPLPCVIQQISLQHQKLEDLQQKARILEQLSNYCQIPKLHAYFNIENYFYLVQEYIEGVNLNSQLEQQGIFSEVQIWQILMAILPILKVLHSQNLIHCDIKPENFIFNCIQNNNLYLVDFAASRLVTANNQLASNMIANPEYSAPEQTQGKPIFTSDLYSLGVTCIYLLTHISPFYLIDIANTKWVWRDYLQSKVSERLSHILDKLMEKDVNCRFQSVDEVMQAMGITCPSNIKIKNQNRGLDCLDTLKVSGVKGVANTIAFTPDTIVSGNDNKTITIWDLQTKKVLHTLIGHSLPVTSVAFSPDGNILATASDDKTIKLWDATFQEICTINGHTRAVKSIAFSPDGILASGSWDKTVKLWDVENKKEIYSLTGHQLQITAVAFSPDGKILASASFDKTIRLWDIPAKQSKNQPCRIFAGHTWAVLAIAFSPDGAILATGSDDNTIKLWSVSSGQEITTLANHSWSVTSLTFDSTGEILISGSKDKTIKLWQVSNFEEIATLSGHEDSVTAVAVGSLDAAQIIASSSKDKTIKLWDLEGIFQNQRPSC